MTPKGEQADDSSMNCEQEGTRRGTECLEEKMMASILNICIFYVPKEFSFEDNRQIVEHVKFESQSRNSVLEPKLRNHHQSLKPRVEILSKKTKMYEFWV